MPSLAPLKADCFKPVSAYIPSVFPNDELLFLIFILVEFGGGLWLLGAGLFDLKCHPVPGKHTGGMLGHPCANATLSQCPLLRLSRCVLVLSGGQTNSLTPHFQGINPAQVMFLEISWNLICLEFCKFWWELLSTWYSAP